MSEERVVKMEDLEEAAAREIERRVKELGLDEPRRPEGLAAAMSGAQSDAQAGAQAGMVRGSTGSRPLEGPAREKDRTSRPATS